MRVTPDGTAVATARSRVRIGGAHRFLPDGSGLIYLPGVESKDFWLLDLATEPGDGSSPASAIAAT